jgi:DNA-binding NtrC family response regulator
MEKNKKPRKLAAHIKIRRAIDAKGVKKNFIAEKLGVSRPTLDKRLQHGGFTDEQIAWLCDNGYYCPND